MQIRLEESERGREEERERADGEEIKAREWKKKWEAVKTELRGVRGLSTLSDLAERRITDLISILESVSYFSTVRRIVQGGFGSYASCY